MEQKQEALALARQIRQTLERCSNELTWDVSARGGLYAKIDEAAEAALSLERRIAAL